jgi:putative PIN family toxin of toxin-antitoxin system
MPNFGRNGRLRHTADARHFNLTPVRRSLTFIGVPDGELGQQGTGEGHGVLLSAHSRRRGDRLAHLQPRPGVRHPMRCDVLWDVSRVVLDTSVIVAALRSRRGGSNALVEQVGNGRLKPLVSTALFLEYEEVLNRPEHRLATRMSEQDVQGFLAAFASAAVAVEVNFRWRPQLSDPKDELVLAVNGQADALVTHNRRDFEPAARLLGLRVLAPRDVLKELDR